MSISYNSIVIPQVRNTSLGRFSRKKAAKASGTHVLGYVLESQRTTGDEAREASGEYLVKKREVSLEQQKLSLVKGDFGCSNRRAVRMLTRGQAIYFSNKKYSRKKTIKNRSV